MATSWPTQAAAIPYRVVDGRVEVLLVTTRGGRWTLPKGGIEPGASAEETAAVEALEEAGVVGRVEPTVGDLTLEKRGRLHLVRVFPLRVATVLDRWEEERVRRRIWVGVAELPRFVERRAVVQLVVAFRHRLLAREVA